MIQYGLVVFLIPTLMEDYNTIQYDYNMIQWSYLIVLFQSTFGSYSPNVVFEATGVPIWLKLTGKLDISYSFAPKLT